MSNALTAQAPLWVDAPAMWLLTEGARPRREIAPVSPRADLERKSVVGAVGVQRKAVFSPVVNVSSSDEEKLFDARVELKTATAQYAMHLEAEVRARIFSEFDYLLEPEAWEMGDVLPTIASYRQFLKWLVFTADRSWSSFGVGDDGNLLVAWVRPHGRMTASFGSRVRWTQEFNADGDRQLSSGNYSLEHFARQANAFLDV